MRNWTTCARLTGIGIAACLLLSPGLTKAEVVDSVIAVVAGRAIKHSDVRREIRLTALLNHETPDLSPMTQQEAASRLVDQAIIRSEIDAGLYAPADPEAANALLAQLQQSYGGSSGFEQTLRTYQLSLNDVRSHLQWQVTVLQFIALRFGEAPSATDPEETEPATDAFIAWLDRMRQDKRITMKQERLH